jgi:transmembrane sensor
MPHLTERELQELSDKWLLGSISADELLLLESWYNQPVVETIDWQSNDAGELALRDRLFKKIDPPRRGIILQPKYLKKRKAYIVATISILLLSITFFWGGAYLKNLDAAASQAQIAHVLNNKVILTLADGSKVYMDKTGKGLVAKQGNIRVNKSNDGGLVYTVENTRGDFSPQLNAISTPTGGLFEVRLADGTKVWLNALSTLKFPTVFSGKTREVELTGEAYFEVAKNKDMPFKVKLAKNTTIQVLGTHFNITAYVDDNSFKATLLEGSISIKKDNQQQLILPGQRAVITDNIEVSEVNADESIAWQKGLFSFDKTDTRNIMKQISRWYGSEVIYLGKTPPNQLTGYIPRSSSLSDVLRMLNISGLQTTLNGNKITVVNN